jgi:BioD-like phosphotransacetylase family protein
MKKLIIASMRRSAGKTSLILGLAEALKKKIGYMKPFGDRLIYHKKRLWDYDSALVANILGLAENPEEMSIGLEHSKLGYMSQKEIKEKLLQDFASMSRGKDILFVEGGRDLAYGSSVHLDAISLARHLDYPMVLVVGAEVESVDDIIFAKKSIGMADIDFKGVIVNKVHDIEDFRNTHLKTIAHMGIGILGTVAFHPQLTHLSVQYLADRLFAKVIAGESGLHGAVKNIFVGAMSANAALRSPKFHKEQKLIITAGDRVDMILAAMDSDTSCIILTNNILPPSNIISKASDRNIPLLLVATDTYQVAQQVDNMEPLLTQNDAEKIALLGQLVKDHVAIDDLLGS